MESALRSLRIMGERAIAEGATILVLSDRDVSQQLIPIPALLAVSSLHHHLIRKGLRTHCSLIVDSGEPRQIHHFALLFGYGASAVSPYLALKSIEDRHPRGEYKNISIEKLREGYVKSIGHGLLKVLSKMGISTLQSYIGAQIFEGVGLNRSLIDDHFTGTVSRIQGIGLEKIEKDSRRRHEEAFEDRDDLPFGGEYSWRQRGKHHLHSPNVIASLQKATRIKSREEFKRYSRLIDDQSQQKFNLRGLLKIKYSQAPLPLSAVEPAVSIVKRFSTGAMSLGSISKEAHETIAVAMNRIGARSNSGEGGEDIERYQKETNGDWKRSAIKQVASGRFGVTSHYLANADEIQIKIAQGAKPGEGGQLPGDKVDPYIASIRYSTPSVPLISPPPHHDIYSIEDLAQLIFDLKNANPKARISVKLVSAPGVGTIAVGVAKAKADGILISGFEGGTGASPLTSIMHCGLPWELGVAETHRMLVQSGLRNRVILQADGQLRTGKDVVIAAMLGAEEWSVGTGALLTLGCIMMRKCHLNTCPVGIATQDSELRKRFRGQPESLINYFFLVAEEVREILAGLGLTCIEELIGRTDLLQQEDSKHWNHIDLSEIIQPSSKFIGVAMSGKNHQDHRLEESIDQNILIPKSLSAINGGKQVSLNLPIANTNRSVGTNLSYEISKTLGKEGLPADSIRLNFYGTAGQSFLAFGAPGITARVEGEVNDYCGKGLSGSRIIVVPPKKSPIVAEMNVIGGNVCLYGATSGRLFMRGMAGERFAVRNSGAHAVVEGIGDHGCEYMTGGRVIVIGPTGRNFAAGMSGGIAYVLDPDGMLGQRVNQEMVRLEPLCQTDDVGFVYEMLKEHQRLTQSHQASQLLDQWEQTKDTMMRILPHAYAEALAAQSKSKLLGFDELHERPSVPYSFKPNQGGIHG